MLPPFPPTRWATASDEYLLRYRHDVKRWQQEHGPWASEEHRHWASWYLTGALAEAERRGQQLRLEGL
jgi:hypothetical protein